MRKESIERDARIEVIHKVEYSKGWGIKTIISYYHLFTT